MERNNMLIIHQKNILDRKRYKKGVKSEQKGIKIDHIGQTEIVKGEVKGR